MLKKVTIVVTSLVFASGILATSIYRAQAEAFQEIKGIEFEVKERVMGAVEGEETATPTAVIEEAEEVMYNLTWPGILPDHFLYPVKMVRDRIWLFLTTDPLKKAELLLKLADKRIWAAEMLLEKDKEDLAASTALKAEKYLEKAIVQEKVAQEKGKNTQIFLEKLSLAVIKHEQVLMAFKDQVGDKAEAVIEEALEYPRHGYEEIQVRLGV